MLNDMLKNIPEVDIPVIEYKDTFFKEMAEDIKQSQEKVESKIDIMIEESKKSDKANSKIAKWTLVVSILTLIATILGIIIQFL